MINDEYTDDRLNQERLYNNGLVGREPSNKAYTITAKRYGKYRDANWMP